MIDSLELRGFHFSINFRTIGDPKIPGECEHVWFNGLSVKNRYSDNSRWDMMYFSNFQNSHVDFEKSYVDFEKAELGNNPKKS